MDLHIMADLIIAATLVTGFAVWLKAQAPARVPVRVDREVHRDVTSAVHDE